MMLLLRQSLLQHRVSKALIWNFDGIARLNLFFQTFSILKVTDEKLKNMDDDELDDMLDKLLVQIVESLADLSPSSVEIQEVLNTPDKSGFTLLHYVSVHFFPASTWLSYDVHFLTFPQLCICRLHCIIYPH